MLKRLFRHLPAFILMTLCFPFDPAGAGQHVIDSETLSSGTRTDYLFDKKLGGLTEEGDAIGIVSILPDGEKYADETARLYKTLFNRSMELSPEIRIAAGNLRQKHYQRYTATARRYAPAIDFTLSQIHRYEYDEVLGTMSENSDEPEYADEADITDWSLDLDLPLYRKNLMVSRDIAGWELKAAEIDLEVKTGQMDVKLREMVGTYMVAAYRLMNLENSVVLSEDHVSKIKRGYELRDQTRLALLRAQANLKELEARVDIERQKKESALRTLLDYTGLEEDDVLLLHFNDLLENEAQSAEVISSFAMVEYTLERLEPFLNRIDEEGLYRIYLNHSSVCKKLRIARDLAESRADRFTEKEWPELSIRADYGREDDTRFSDFETEGEVGLHLEIPLFTGGTLFSSNKTRIEARQLAVEKQRSDNRATFNRLMNRKKALQNLRSVYRKQEINLLQQQEIVRLSIKSYAIKQTSMQDLLTSKNKLIDVKNQLMETAMNISSQARFFAWELGVPFSVPDLAYVEKLRHVPGVFQVRIAPATIENTTFRSYIKKLNETSSQP